MADIVERLRSSAPLPLCPFEKRSPEYYTTPNDQPCKFCGGLPEGPDKCTGADMRIMSEAADEIERLQRERNYAVRWANKSVDAVKEHDDAIICRMQAALEKCQKALAAMIDPSCIAQSTVLNAFAMATEAEAAARAALEADQCAS